LTQRKGKPLNGGGRERGGREEGVRRGRGVDSPRLRLNQV